MTYRARCTGRRYRPRRTLTDTIRKAAADSHLRWQRLGRAEGRRCMTKETRRQRRRRLYEEGRLERLGSLTLSEVLQWYTIELVPIDHVDALAWVYTELDK